MPEQPHNSAEETLQRYAKERRASGGNFALHPATRRLLQGEVARQHGPAKNPRGGFANWFTAWRMAGASGVMAVLLGVGVWIFSHQPKTISEPTTDLAKLSTPSPETPLVEMKTKAIARREALKAEAAGSGGKDADLSAVKYLAEKPSSLSPAQSVATTTTMTFFADSVTTAGASDPQVASNYSGGRNATANYGIVAQSQMASANAQQQSAGASRSSTQNSLPSQTADRYFRARENQANTSSAAAPQEQNAPAPQNSVAANRNLIATAPVNAPRADGGAAQNFYKQELPAVTTPNLAANNTSPRAIGGALGVSGAGGGQRKQAADEARNVEVLDRFSFEEQGSAVRLIDADGSVYSGAFTAESADKSAASLALGKQAESLRSLRDAPTVATRSRSFRATGTNRTLNELVVVDGKVSSVTSPQPLTFVTSSTAAKAKDLAAQRVPAAPSVPTTTPLPRAAGFAGATTNPPPTTEIEATVRVGGTERGLRAFPVPR